MSQKRSDDAQHVTPDAALHESFPSVAVPAAKGPVSLDAHSYHWSPEAKARRAKLLADLNEGWSEKSERALSVVAERFLPKT